MESYGTHEILATKSHQIQWNLMGPMGFSKQISSNPKESYGIHENPSVLIIENLKKNIPQMVDF